MPPMPKTVRPSMLLTPLLALGRAPLVDYLWLRATRLKEEGRFFDAYQLSEMICELQPKFAAVWGFQGWNMAYNISVTLKSPEERWRWVRNGYELIRDKGIPLNPNNTQLYRELAWILFHKVGDFMDEWHFYYKLQFALLMEDILGPPPEDYVQPGRVAGDYYREYDYASLAEAPERFEELVADADVAELAEKLRGFGFDVDKSGVYLGLLAALRDGTAQVPNAPEGERETRLHDLKALMNDPATAPPRKRIEHYWRARRLREEMKLDLRRIVTIQKDFGVTLDFRLPEAHALYWANLGMEKGLDARTNVDIHKLNTNRIEFFCLQKMFHRGRLAMSENAKLGEPPLLSPDIRVIPALFDALVRDSKTYLEEEHEKSPVSINFRTTFVGFARTAIMRYHRLGMQKEAQEMFDYLSKNFPDKMYDKGLDGFLTEQMKGEMEVNDFRIVEQRVEELIRAGIVRYAYGEDDEAVRYMARAKQVYEGYQKGVVSKRLKIQAEFAEIVQTCVHQFGGQMYRGSYEIVCRKLGLEPLPQETSTKPADVPA